jgi:hypothetical protein
MRLIKARSDLSKPGHSISIRIADDRSLVLDGPEIAIALHPKDRLAIVAV